VNEAISYTGLSVSLFLPWLLGGVWVYWLTGRTGRWNLPLVAGHGYLVGIFAVTILIRLWDSAGLGLHFWAIAAIAALLTVLGSVLVVSRSAAPPVQSVAGDPVPAWHRVLIVLLLALIGWRCFTLAQEILLRPLFPWDAWMNWAPKAIVWHHYRNLVPFVSPDSWLTAPADALNYTEGAGNAWKYPVAIPLVQLWGMLGAGTSDHTLIYLPWFFIAMAAGLSLYGHLRLLGLSRLHCTVGAYLLLSVPLVNVHTALAGYADLWVAVVFGCAIFALKEWDGYRNWQYAVLALVLALFCTQLKIPGLVMGGIILLAFIISLVRLKLRQWVALSTAFALIFLALLLAGIDIHFPGIGRLAVDSEKIIVPYVGKFDITYHPIHEAMAKALFLMLSWNLLWYYGVLGIILFVMCRRDLKRHRMELITVAAALIFIFSVYYFTERYRFALDFTQLNRALLYTVPGLVFCLLSLTFSPNSITATVRKRGGGP